MTVPDNETPLASGTGGQENTINDNPTPLAGGVEGAWALLNLILAIVTAVISIVLLVGYFFGRKHKNDEGEKGELKRKGMSRLLSLLPGIGGIVAFLLTENMRNPMVITDQWTLLMIVIAVVQAVVVLFSIKKHKDAEEEQPQNA